MLRDILLMFSFVCPVAGQQTVVVDKYSATNVVLIISDDKGNCLGLIGGRWHV